MKRQRIMAATLAVLASLLFGTAGATGAGIPASGSVAGSGTLAIAAPILSSAKSRKVHGASGAFDLLLAPTPENPATEPRSGGPGGAHAVVFTFDKAVSGGTAIVAAGTGSAGAPTFSGSEMSVPLNGVADAQYVTVSVASVASADGAVRAAADRCASASWRATSTAAGA